MNAEEALQRQKGETALAFNAFADYLAMPVTERSLRKLLACYNQSEAGEAVPTKHLTTLKGWSTTHRWQERAAAIEAEERRTQMRLEAEARQKMNEQHIRLAQAAQYKVCEWLRDPTNQLKRPADVSTLLKYSTDLERKARGIPDTVLQLTTLSDEELLARYVEMRDRLYGSETTEDTEPAVFVEDDVA